MCIKICLFAELPGKWRSPNAGVKCEWTDAQANEASRQTEAFLYLFLFFVYKINPFLLLLAAAVIFVVVVAFIILFSHDADERETKKAIQEM